jgi:hypothetical protein
VILQAADICALESEPAAKSLMAQGVAKCHGYAFQTERRLALIAKPLRSRSGRRQGRQYASKADADRRPLHAEVKLSKLVSSSTARAYAFSSPFSSFKKRQSVA